MRGGGGRARSAGRLMRGGGIEPREEFRSRWGVRGVSFEMEGLGMGVTCGKVCGDDDRRRCMESSGEHGHSLPVAPGV